MIKVSSNLINLLVKRHSSHNVGSRVTKITIPKLIQKYQSKEAISMLTAYDKFSAQVAMAGKVDCILIGDSLAMVALGHETTHPVTLGEMIHHCRAVKRGLDALTLGGDENSTLNVPFVIGDMPFGSYEVGSEEAVRAAIQMVKESGVQAVKLEGSGSLRADAVYRIVQAGVPVMGHVGLLPQSFNVFGGFKVQGKTADQACKLLNDALELQRAGAFAIVLEAVPSPVAQAITERLKIPTIGIGAGNSPHCVSGQVLVQSDMLGHQFKITSSSSSSSKEEAENPSKTTNNNTASNAKTNNNNEHSNLIVVTPAKLPKFCKLYANVASASVAAAQQYVREVGEGTFPGPQYQYNMEKGELETFKRRLQELDQDKGR